jgi:hypothetical protein
MKTFEALIVVSLPVTLIMFAIGEVFVRYTVDDLPKDFIIQTKHYHSTYHHPPKFDQSSLFVDPKRQNIAFLGDSFTWGYRRLSRNDTIPKFFRRAAQDEYDWDVNVINLGTPSYSPMIERLIWENIGKQLKPNYVVLLLDESDVQDDAIYASTARWQDDGLEAVDPIHLEYSTPWARSKLLRLSYFVYNKVTGGTFQGYTNKIYRFSDMANPDCSAHRIYCLNRRESYSHRDKAQAYYLPYYTETLMHIEAIHRSVTSSGAKFLLVTYPYPAALDVSNYAKFWRVRYGYPLGIVLRSLLQPVVEEWAEKSGIDYLDVTDIIATHPNITSLYPRNNAHYNRNGNEIVAQAILRKIRALNRLDPKTD